MSELSKREQAVELLQDLGLKEYEARCFVALSQLSSGTAREISDLSEVPRTRVYDAVRVLETKGLVEVQHSNPQQFRAVNVAEAKETILDEYASRTARFEETIQDIPKATPDEESDQSHEVWSLSGEAAISNRIEELIADAEEEVVLIAGHDDLVTDRLLDAMAEAADRDVDLLVGTIDQSLKSRVESALPSARVFVSGLEWLAGPVEGASATDGGTDAEIGRLLLVDRGTVLASSVHSDADSVSSTERAVVGRGFTNGFIVIARRLLATGLFPVDDQGAIAE